MSYTKEPKRNIAADYLQRYVDDNFAEGQFLGGDEHRIPGADLQYPGQQPDLYYMPVFDEEENMQQEEPNKYLTWT